MRAVTLAAEGRHRRLGSIGTVSARSVEDTTPEVFDLYIDTLRAMSPIERVRIADRLSVDVAALAETGIRARWPALARADLLHELARRRYGSALADAAFQRSRPA